MLNHVDQLMRHLLIDRIDGIDDESQVRFQPPDEDWRTYVSTLSVGGQPASALNVYLVDVRENRKLRSNQATRDTQLADDGIVREVSAPRRVDCHYLISAWSPGTPSPAFEPTLDEHMLLYRTIAALNTADPIVPRAVYAPNPLPPAFPTALADEQLPTTLLPVEGFAKLPEFWGTMGEGHRLRPTIYLIVTVPVLYEPRPMGGMVTTTIARYRVRDTNAPHDVRIEIGGHVFDSTQPLPDGSPAPLVGAWVALETTTAQRLQLTRTNGQGRFTFASLQADDYRLRASTESLGELIRDIHVPSPSAEYDITF